MSGYYVSLIKIIGFFNVDFKKTSVFIAEKGLKT